MYEYRVTFSLMRIKFIPGCMGQWNFGLYTPEKQSMNSKSFSALDNHNFYYMEKSSRMLYNKESNTMNKSQIERRNHKWNVEMHGFLIQKRKKKN